jgi:uncharacterized protein (DUF427 family)
MKSPSSSPGHEYRSRLGHPLNVEPGGPRVQVTYRGEVIADSRDALRFEEAMYPPVYYFPRQDVMMERLERSSHESFCAYKGYATYYSIKNGPEDAVWSYEDPYDKMRALEGRIAFYPDKVDSILIG